MAAVLATKHWRRVAGYACALGAGAFALDWLQYQMLVRRLDASVYVMLIAAAFTGLGLWIGHYLTRAPAQPEPPAESRAKELGLTRRECEVLTLLAEGMANKQIAEALHMSPNTVKTHLSRLFTKLDVKRRTQAVQKARQLNLLS